MIEHINRLCLDGVISVGKSRQLGGPTRRPGGHQDIAADIESGGSPVGADKIKPHAIRVAAKCNPHARDSGGVVCGGAADNLNRGIGKDGPGCRIDH